MNSYVLITPAKNEEVYLEKTIQAVVSQTYLPDKWVIVDDGSTDGTIEIVERYASDYDFIELVRLIYRDNRNFASKIRAFKAGLEKLVGIHFEFMGNLDADISFPDDYYEQVLKKFQKYPKLGITGGIIFEMRKNKHVKLNPRNDTIGCAIQMFRRKCYEDVGGYMELKFGGEDVMAEMTARMKGWEVRAFPELEVLHNREMGSGIWNIWESRFYAGVENYDLGYHPFFFILKSISRILERPAILGSILMLSGYFWFSIIGAKRIVSNEFIKFLQNEQKQKMKSAVLELISGTPNAMNENRKC